MKSVERLRQALAPQRAAMTGTVIGIDGDLLRIRTLRGVVTATGGRDLRVDDDVLVRDGVVLRRVRPASSVPVYYV
jgi:hypothetical protein